MIELRLYLIQRLSAALLVVMGAVHLTVIVDASRSTPSAAEILAHTHSSPAWPAFYTLFSLTAATHATIGLRTVAREWLGVRNDALALVLWIALAGLGLRAVWSLV